VKIVEHWLMSREKDVQQRVFAAMREIGLRVDAEWAKARALAPRMGEVGLGGQDFDAALRASIGEAYLRALRHGAEPCPAQEAAAAEMAELTTGFNRKVKAGRFATTRSPTSESDFLAALHRIVIDAVEPVEPIALKEAA
jgi:hypothetical protein